VADTIFTFYQEDALCSDLFLLMDDPDTAIIPHDYTNFFQVIHPNLVYLREDYVGSQVWAYFKQACGENRVALIQVSPQLYRLVYP